MKTYFQSNPADIEQDHRYQQCVSSLWLETNSSMSSNKVLRCAKMCHHVPTNKKIKIKYKNENRFYCAEPIGILIQLISAGVTSCMCPIMEIMDVGAFTMIVRSYRTELALGNFLRTVLRYNPQLPTYVRQAKKDRASADTSVSLLLWALRAAGSVSEMME